MSDHTTEPLGLLAEDADDLKVISAALQDAVAKLRGVSISFVQGERVDGADVRALDQVIVWLETQSLTRPPTGIAALLTDMFAPAAQTPPSPRAGDPSRE